MSQNSETVASPSPVVSPPPGAASSLLADWLAAEDAVRERHTCARPTAPPTREQFATLTGLQVMQGLLRGEMAPPSISHTLDFLLIEVNHGHAVFQGTPGPGHLNPMGGVHGGWYATLLDSALGCCVHTALPAGKGYTTLELKVNLVRALTPKVQRVRAEGRVIHVGGQTATADARLVGPDGKLYAHGSTTCLVFNLPTS
ncbi:MAG: PaaI family thioesterase [Chitinophagaceae bacterium]|nr:PaaI family thioesterase [Rubrivivax sp.]